ncbi:GNAT family N-acetyltransferase [Aquimarina mytili]|uniref:GNAT family N-acetyltransferase n=1 Tax=Aquimarina mytili TaxID=874423 RepID=A0A937A0Z1_9FLAO|nr:GNAT family protein [Aquimarina mytili]MBL0685583.1 GNAT family N-acetyltransferase [Aquimarina mytili]
MLQFDFTKKHILENDVVQLRPLLIEDVPHLLEIANEPDIWEYSFVKGNGEKKLTSYIQSAIDGRKTKKEYPFIVYDKVKKQYAGSTRYCEIMPALSAIRLGYTWYGSAFRGTGLNKNCKYLLFEFAFETMKAERIGMAAYIENTISIAAMKSVGCIQEGVLRGIFPALDGKGRTDAVLLSILKKEWISKEKMMLKAKLKK